MASWVFDDGGRTAAGFKGTAGDCVARAVAIASGRPYSEVYQRLASIEGSRRRSKHLTKRKAATARNGIATKRPAFKAYMAELGFEWVPTMQIGSGCTTHLRAGELPTGRLIVALSNHYAAVIDGVVHDSHDPRRAGRRCVYGYWKADSTNNSISLGE